MQVVRLRRAVGIWNAGETAGFQPARAAELIASGVAELVTPEVQPRVRARLAPAAKPKKSGD